MRGIVKACRRRKGAHCRFARTISMGLYQCSLVLGQWQHDMRDEPWTLGKPVIPSAKVRKIRVRDIEGIPSVADATERDIGNRELFPDHVGSAGKVVVKHAQTRFDPVGRRIDGVMIAVTGSRPHQADKQGAKAGYGRRSPAP